MALKVWMFFAKDFRVHRGHNYIRFLRKNWFQEFNKKKKNSINLRGLPKEKESALTLIQNIKR